MIDNEIKSYKELSVWQSAQQLVRKVYKTTNALPKDVGYRPEGEYQTMEHYETR